MKKNKIGSDFSGVGALNQALKKSKINYEEIFACDMDKFARKTFVLNYGTKKDIEISNSPGHDNICDKLKKIINGELKLSDEKMMKFEEDMENLANSFSFYFPLDVYKRKIPEAPLDLYVTTPPCQSFSIAGKRLGEEDKRGILFYNSHDFIKKNKPKSFIFENVKGLLSDNKKSKTDKIGQTLTSWITLLGGKSVNGSLVMFPHPDSVPYNIYWKVINAKDQGVPQNRERIFIVGIRGDKLNFRFPKDIKLKKRIGDILESEVDEKYLLSEEMIKGYVETGPGKGFINQDTQASRVFCESGTFSTLTAGEKGYNNGYVRVGKLSRTEEAKEQRRLTGTNDFQGKKLEFEFSETMNCITTALTRGNLIKINDIIRKLTPRECFRLMDFCDSFKWDVSDSQAYKQAGNSIVRKCLIIIIKQILK